MRGGVGAGMLAAAVLGAAMAVLLHHAAGRPLPEAAETAPPPTGDAVAGIDAWRLAAAPTPPPREASLQELAGAFGEATPSQQAVMLRGIAMAEADRLGGLLRALPPAGDAGVRSLQAALAAIAVADPPLSAMVAAEGVPTDALRQAASDPRRPPFERRVAAALLREDRGEASRALAASLGEFAPADPDGGVAAAVLAAESLLDPTAAEAVAQRWIGSFEDDRKRAGLLLLSLVADPEDPTGRIAAVLKSPLWTEASPPLRRIHAAAEFALGRWSQAVPPEQLFARLRQDEDGGVDLDLLLGRLAGGDAEAVEILLDLPPPPRGGAASVQRWERELAIRGLLRRRFLPELQAAIGDPAAADRAAILRHRDRAVASWWLARTTLRFDAAGRQWRHAASEAPPPRDSPR